MRVLEGTLFKEKGAPEPPPKTFIRGEYKGTKNMRLQVSASNLAARRGFFV